MENNLEKGRHVQFGNIKEKNGGREEMWFSFNDSGFQVNNWTLTNCWENFLCLRIGILAFRFPLAQQPLTPGNFLLLGKLFNRIPHLKLLNLAFLSGNKIALIHFFFFFILSRNAWNWEKFLILYDRLRYPCSDYLFL